MNERIKQLTGQALDQAMPQTWYGISPEDLDRIAFTLAELIVQECINTVSDCSVEYCTRPQIVSEIKEHFGVEE